MDNKNYKIFLILSISLVVLSLTIARLMPDRFIAWFFVLCIETGQDTLFALLIYLITPKHRIYLRWLARYLLIYFIIFNTISYYIDMYGAGDVFDMIVRCLKIAYILAIAITMLIVKRKARKLKEERLFR